MKTIQISKPPFNNLGMYYHCLSLAEVDTEAEKNNTVNKWQRQYMQLASAASLPCSELH